MTPLSAHILFHERRLKSIKSSDGTRSNSKNIKISFQDRRRRERRRWILLAFIICIVISACLMGRYSLFSNTTTTTTSLQQQNDDERDDLSSIQKDYSMAMSKEEPIILSGNIIINSSTSIMQGEVIQTTNSSDGNSNDNNATQNLVKQIIVPNVNTSELQLTIDSMIASNNITAKEPATENVLQSNQTITSAGRNNDTLSDNKGI